MAPLTSSSIGRWASGMARSFIGVCCGHHCVGPLYATKVWLSAVTLRRISYANVVSARRSPCRRLTAAAWWRHAHIKVTGHAQGNGRVGDTEGYDGRRDSKDQRDGECQPAQYERARMAARRRGQDDEHSLG